MKKRILSLVLIFSILLPTLPMGALTAFAQDNTLYGDADGNGKVELLDVNLMERYIAGEEEAKASIHFTEADVNADGTIDDTDVQMVKEYLVGNLDSLTPQLHTISFITDGGGDFAPIKAGNGYPYRGELPTPAKDNYVFVNWEMENGAVYYPLTEVISSDITLKAVYEPVDSKEELNLTSFSLDNQSADVSFEIVGEFSDVEDVKANIKVFPKDGSEPVAVEVKANGDSSFTVYAPDGFKAGASYELTLGEGLTFAEKDAMFRTVYFIIKKDEADNLKYNADMIFIKDTEEMKYTIGSQTVDVLEAALLSNDESQEAITGSFTMTTQDLEKDDIVCIYETTDPRDRDYTESSYEGDAMAFIRITGVDGDTFSFESLDEEDSQEVLAMPDSFPFKVENLPTEDGTVDINSYDAYALSMMGQTTTPEFKVDDFLTFYTVDFSDLTDETPAVYGQITKVEGHTISYKIVDKQYIDDFMGLFVSQTVDNETLLENIDQEAFLNQVEQQAQNSGFAEEAANQMTLNALQTDEVQQKLLDAGFTEEEIQQLSVSPAAAGGGRVQFGLDEQPRVKANFLVGEHFKNGVGLQLDVSVVLSISKKMATGKTTSLKIQLTAGFEQEVALDFDIDVDDRWKWYFIIPILEDIDVTASIDIQNYTYMSVGAKVYTVSEENIKKWKNLSTTISDNPSVQETIRKINKLGAKVKKMQSRGEEVKAILAQIESYKQQLPGVKVDGAEYSIEQLEEALGAEDVSAAFDEVFSAKNEAEAKTGMEQLMDRYKQMLEQECDWVELYNQPLITQTYWIAIAAVKVDLNFVVKANVNIQLGADMEYQVGKRYSFWLHLLGKTSGSSEMDLIDERFAFQFYVMGTLGVKAGIRAEIAFGLLSTDLASIGANVEFGAYVKLYGYFIYYFEKLRPANEEHWNETEEMMGALYIDFGLYVTVKFKAQVFLNAIKYEPTLYDAEFPLLTAGVEESVYGFTLEPDEDDVLYIKDIDNDSTTGITMPIPDSHLTMKRINLTTGEKSEAPYAADKFIVTFDDSRFKMNNKGIISVDVPAGTRYLSSNMRIVWKSDKLSFSKYDIDITVPVVWTNMSETELNEKFTASVAVGNETDGYTTVWSARYGRLDVFDLPTEEEILQLIDYDSYTTEDGTNLKYAQIDGYQESSTGLSLKTDKTYFFNVTPKTYTLTVTDVEKADGSTENRTYTAKYGETFDLSDLESTGTANNETHTYTRFLNLTNPNEPDEEKAAVDRNSLTMDMGFIKKYGSTPAFKANYLDTTLTATYQFVGLGNDVQPVKVNFQSGTAPYYEGLADYVKEHGGANAAIVSVSPAIMPSESSITYTVVCRIDEEAKPSYTLSFDTQGGNTIAAQTYPEGSMIFQPTNPTRTGYTFAGWYQDKACNTPFDFSINMPGSDITAYAKWTANTYTLSFSTTTGSAPASRQITYGEKYGELPVLSDSVMSFKGWYTEASGGTQVTADTVFTGTANQTLYAHWEQKAEIQSDWITITSRTENYDENEPGFPVSISVNAPNGDLTAEDFTVSYLWEKSGSEWTTEAPVNAGSYLVKLSREADDTYLPFELITEQPAVVINRLNLTLRSPEASISNWIAKVDISKTGYKGDGKITYIMKRTYTTSDGYPTSSEVARNTTGTFDISSYGHGASIYAFGIVVDMGTNYNGASSKFKSYNVNEDGNGGNIWGRSSLSLAGNTEPADMTENTAQPMIMAVMPAALFAKAAPTTKTLTEESEDNATMTLSPEEVILNRGKEFEVTLGLDQAADIWGILAAVDYDVNTLELLGYTCGDIFTETQFTAQNDLTAAPYKLLATLDEIGTTSADGNFVTLKFKVKENAEEKETTVSLSTLEVVGKEEAVSVNMGNDVRMAVDETVPVIEGIENGKTYCPGQTFTVSDINLESVTVNGEVQTPVDGSYTVAADADGKCTIVAADKAGNSTTYTVTATHIWSESWITDENSHWHECACGEKTDVTEHQFVWVVTKEAEIGVAGEKHEECEICGYEKASVEIPALVDDSQTGDNRNLWIWIGLLFVSGGVMGILTLKRKKQMR